MFVYWCCFFVMGFYLYHNERIPTLISVCLMACGIASTFHHTRRYHEPGWEKDGSRAMDSVLVVILGETID